MEDLLNEGEGTASITNPTCTANCSSQCKNDCTDNV